MEFDGEFQVKAPVQDVWEAFLNPEKTKSCMPDLQKLEVYDPDHYRTVVKVGISFIKGQFDFDVKVVEREEPKRARLKAHGKGRGSAVDVDSVIELSEADGGTHLKWRSDAKVHGTLASVGARLLKSTAEKKVNEFFDCVQDLLEEGERG